MPPLERRRNARTKALRHGDDKHQHDVQHPHRHRLNNARRRRPVDLKIPQLRIRRQHLYDVGLHRSAAGDEGTLRGDVRVEPQRRKLAVEQLAERADQWRVAKHCLPRLEVSCRLDRLAAAVAMPAPLAVLNFDGFKLKLRLPERARRAPNERAHIYHHGAHRQTLAVALRVHLEQLRRVDLTDHARKHEHQKVGRRRSDRVVDLLVRYLPSEPVALAAIARHEVPLEEPLKLRVSAAGRVLTLEQLRE